MIKLTAKVQATTAFGTVIDGTVIAVNRTARKVTSYDVLTTVAGVTTVLQVFPNQLQTR